MSLLSHLVPCNFDAAEFDFNEDNKMQFKTQNAKSDKVNDMQMQMEE